MHRLIRQVIPLLTVLALLASAAAQAKGSRRYDQIALEGPIETTLPDGSTRTLKPSCSGGPVLSESGPVAADTDFSFFVQKGNPDKLLFMFDGGGACWDFATCIGAALTDAGVYSQTVDETEQSAKEAGGILDRRNPENPVRNFTKVFIPYCTADIHMGSRDTTYEFEGLEWTIHHRGADNFLAVLDWLKRNGKEAYGMDIGRVKNVVVTGASAGGYGAALGVAFIAEMTPDARHHLLSDAAIGVISNPFYTTALYNPMDPGSESWGMLDNLPPWVPGLNETLLAEGVDNPSGFANAMFAVLADYKPGANLASITANLDSVQIFFYSLMELKPPQEVAGDWYLAMAESTAAAASLPRYRFFIEDGTFHTFIGDNERTYGVGANGISFAEWLRIMVTPGNKGWENLDAGPPSL